MACIEFFKSSRVTRTEDADGNNNITEVLNSDGTPSQLWARILNITKSDFTESNIHPEYRKYLDILQKNGLIGDWKANNIEARLGLMSILTTDQFTNRFGDVTKGTFIGNSIDGEIVTKGTSSTIFVGNDSIFLNSPAIINRTKKSAASSLKSGKLTWVMPGTDVADTVSTLANLTDADKKGKTVDIDAELARFRGQSVDEMMEGFDTMSEEEVYSEYVELLTSLKGFKLSFITSNMALMQKASSIYYSDSYSKMDKAYRLKLQQGLAINEKAAIYLASEGTAFSDVIRNKNKEGNEEFSAIRALDEMLVNNPKLVSDVIYHLVGKQQGADVKSQLLSAATDNAKELILGKIRSNDFTNGIITSMLIMGYDLTSIIDFLHDPSIEATLVAFNKKLENGDKAILTWDSITNTAALTGIINNSSMRSLQEILSVSDDIMAFGSIRSLSENFKIESFDMDKIFDTIRVDLLHEAIANNDIDSLFVEGKIFNPEVFIFLHPHSRLVFKNLYITERFIIPTMFKTAPVVKGFLKSSERNIEAYRAAKRYINKMMVESFFSSTQKDGNVLTFTDTYTGESFGMDSAQNRSKLLKSFPNMIENSKKLLKRHGIVNMALEAMTFETKYGSSTPIMNIRSYSSSETDAIVKGSIGSAIKELNTSNVNTEVDRIQSEIYNNLGLYLLMTGGGDVNASSIFGMFSDINHQFSEHVNTLNHSFYAGIGMSADPEAGSVEVDVLKPLMLDKFKDIVEITTIRSSFGDEHVEAQSDMVGVDIYADMEEGMPMEVNTGKGPSLNVLSALQPVLYSQVANNKVFQRAGSSYTEGAIYLGVEDSMPFQLFDSADGAALPNSSQPTSISFQNIPGNVMDALNLSGKQVGYDSIYNGNDIRILNYVGQDIKTGQSLYTIYNINKDAFYTVSGYKLLKANSSLALFGNMIGPLTGRNERVVSRQRDAMGITTDVVKDKVAAAIGLNQVSIDARLKKEFSGVMNLFQTSHIEEELRLANMSSSILTVDGTVTNDPMYNTFRESEYKKFDASENSFFIPLLRERGNIDKLAPLNASISDRLVEVMNNKIIGEEVTFTFMFKEDVMDGINNPAQAFKDAFEHMDSVTYSHEQVKNSDGTHSGAWITTMKKVQDTKMMMFNGENVKVSVSTKEGNLVVESNKGKEFNAQAKLAAVYNDLDEGVYGANVVRFGKQEYMHISPGNLEISYIYEVISDNDSNLSFSFIGDSKSASTLNAQLDSKIKNKDKDVRVCGL